MRRHAPLAIALAIALLAVLSLALYRARCRPATPLATPLTWRAYLAHHAHARNHSATVLVSACLHPGHFPPLSTPELQSRYQAIQLSPADGPGPVALVYLDRQAPHAPQLLSLLADQSEYRLLLTLSPHPSLPDTLLITAFDQPCRSNKAAALACDS